MLTMRIDESALQDMYAMTWAAAQITTGLTRSRMHDINGLCFSVLLKGGLLPDSTLQVLRVVSHKYLEHDASVLVDIIDKAFYRSIEEPMTLVDALSLNP